MREFETFSTYRGIGGKSFPVGLLISLTAESSSSFAREWNLFHHKILGRIKIFLIPLRRTYCRPPFERFICNKLIIFPITFFKQIFRFSWNLRVIFTISLIWKRTNFPLERRRLFNDFRNSGPKIRLSREIVEILERVQRDFQESVGLKKTLSSKDPIHFRRVQPGSNPLEDESPCWTSWRRDADVADV